MIEQAIGRVVEGRDLSVEQMRGAVEAIMSGQCSEAEMAALLTALRMKGESVEELVGGALVMRQQVRRIDAGREDLLDTCGTGGDGLSTFNISTAAALVAAACGVPVAKHGNRSVSSTSGSAEVLQSLGVNIEVEVPVVEQCIRRLGIGFCYAPLLHPSMRHAMPVRRQIRFRTIFNLLGPLTNPAGARFQLLGVSRRDLVEKMGQALNRLGTRRAYVVCGHDGLDEVTLTGPTYVAQVANGKVTSLVWHPADFGLGQCRLGQLQVSSPADSAAVIRRVLEGRPGPARDMVVANTAAALLAAERVADLPSGVAAATEAIDNGAAQRTLQALIDLTAANAA